MLKLWNKIVLFGISAPIEDLKTRNLIVANKINLILFLFTIVVSIIAAVMREVFDGEFTIHTKKLLILALVTGLNVFFAYKKLHHIVRFNLIVFPTVIFIFLPLLLGYVQKLDFYVAPLAILAFSLFPTIILIPNFKKLPYILSFFFFLSQILTIDFLMKYFAKDLPLYFEDDSTFKFYYQLVLLSVFAFIHIIIYHHRRINLIYDKRLKESNEELKSNIEELKSTQELLVQTEKMTSLGTLTAGVAHEINNPLNFIVGGLTGLNNTFNFEESSDERVNLFHKSIKEGVDRISEIVTGLNQLTRENDSLTEKCDVHNIINNCFLILHHLTIENIKLTKDYTESEVFVKGNISKLHQAFLNIIANSIEAIEGKGKIEVVTKLKEGSVIVKIIDDGKGIGGEHINQITDPFYTTKPPGQGTGLGLALTNSIISEHQGSLKFKSELGKGTTVVVELPVN